MLGGGSGGGRCAHLPIPLEESPGSWWGGMGSSSVSMRLIWIGEKERVISGLLLPPLTLFSASLWSIASRATLRSSQRASRAETFSAIGSKLRSCAAVVIASSASVGLCLARCATSDGCLFVTLLWIPSAKTCAPCSAADVKCLATYQDGGAYQGHQCPPHRLCSFHLPPHSSI